jgi:hypothetical protein
MAGDGRAKTSVEPPGGKGTTQSTVLLRPLRGAGSRRADREQAGQDGSVGQASVIVQSMSISVALAIRIQRSISRPTKR